MLRLEQNLYKITVCSKLEIVGFHLVSHIPAASRAGSTSFQDVCTVVCRRNITCLSCSFSRHLQLQCRRQQLLCMPWFGLTKTRLPLIDITPQGELDALHLRCKVKGQKEVVSIKTKASSAAFHVTERPAAGTRECTHVGPFLKLAIALHLHGGGARLVRVRHYGIVLSVLSSIVTTVCSLSGPRGKPSSQRQHLSANIFHNLSRVSFVCCNLYVAKEALVDYTMYTHRSLT